MKADQRNSTSQVSEEHTVPPEKSAGESETSRYRFIMYCGLEKEDREES